MPTNIYLPHFFRNRYDTNQAQYEVIMTSAYFYFIIASKDDIYL